MPAVTVDNILALDRVSRPAADGVVRAVRHEHSGSVHRLSRWQVGRDSGRRHATHQRLRR